MAGICIAGVMDLHCRCAGGGGDKCRKVKCAGGAQEVVGISAEKSNACKVCKRCTGG